MSTDTFEVRIKNNGRLFSRHYTVNKPKQAAERARKEGKVLWVRKVHPSDIIGNIKLELKPMSPLATIEAERRPDVILDNVTLDSIIFPKRQRQGQKKNRRFTSGN